MENVIKTRSQWIAQKCVVENYNLRHYTCFFQNEHFRIFAEETFEVSASEILENSE